MSSFARASGQKTEQLITSSLEARRYFQLMGRTTAFVVVAAVVVGCGYGVAQPKVSGQAQAAGPSAASLGPVTARVTAAGDIACATPESTKPGCQAADTTALTERLHPAAVLALGDLVYESGSIDEFTNGYAPTWGRFKAKTFAVPGNHEYNTDGAAGYRSWWGATALPSGTTWHSKRIGGWLILGLDSNCGDNGGCGPTSPQGRWLAGQLKASPRCVLAIWHHPRRSSGPHGDNSSTQPLWAALSAKHADLVLNGHDHDYERFQPMNANANPAKTGLTEVVVGTGGKELYPFTHTATGSAKRIQGFAGVLLLSLRQRGWSWAFTTVDGKVRDSGSAACQV
ncbi:unannotated protein [freshwater metagenome]|uniref:Unannotated protein n=1 Tax=freshwater metagenome TaxID=449393 RepID=A0A6J7DW05_9ZZZZ